MARNQKGKINASGLPKSIIIGGITSICCTIMGTCIGAWLLASEKIGENSDNYLALSILLLSSVAGSLISMRMAQDKHTIVGISVGLVYFLALLGIAAVFFRGSYNGVGESALVIGSGIFSSVLLGIKNRKKPKMVRRM